MNLFCKPIVLLAGAIIPAILSLHFILTLAVPTIFWDEWGFVPLVIKIFKGDEILSLELISLHNEHLIFFPRLIVLGLASISSYNLFLEIIVGWIFLSFTILVLWFLLIKTAPEAKWTIIPITWLSYSFIQYENFLWGWSSINWYLITFCVVASIYVLNNAKESNKSFWLFIIFSLIATFTNIIGNIIWLLGLTYFRTFKKRYYAILIVFFILAIIIYFLLLEDNQNYNKIDTITNEPIEKIKYVLIYLGGAVRISPNFAEQIYGALTAGIVIFSIFMTMITYYHFKIRKKLESNIRPWVNLCLFGILAAIITAIGRINFGVEQALANRYVAVSNLFLDGVIVITVIILTHLIQNEQRQNRKKILKGILVIFIILLGLYIVDSYIAGWIGGTIFHDRLSKGTNCLLNYETASDDCLELLIPNAETLKKSARILDEMCLGPFVLNCN